MARPAITLNVGGKSVSYPVLDRSGYELPSDFKALLQYLDVSLPVDDPVMIAWTLIDETNKTKASEVVAIVADPPAGSKAEDASIPQLLQLCRMVVDGDLFLARAYAKAMLVKGDSVLERDLRRHFGLY